jgi:hypothetical protein
VSLTDIFLGIIALATLIMALIQVGAIVAIGRLAREAQKTLASVQQDVKPIVAKVSAMADEASHTATIVKAQADKVDVLITELTRRIDETSAVVQQAVITPAREGLAIVAAIKATLMALRGFRDLRPGQGRHAEEDDPLFIG